MFLRRKSKKDKMRTYTCDRPNEIYKDVILDILKEGHEVSPRGIKTLEINPAIHHVLSPVKRLCSVPGRKANPFFNLAENMWILAGFGDSEWVSSFNNKLNEYQLDDGHTDYSAPYGRRIRYYNRHRKGQTHISLNQYVSTDIRSLPQVDQLLHCWSVLSKDKYSRHAVVTLWNPLFDYFTNETKDRPCNTTIYFKIRKNDKGLDALNMTVSNRSNDLHLGLYGVNFVQFSHIQEFLAASLNVEIGHYTHISDSLHVYDSSQHTGNILDSGYNFDIYEFVKPKVLSYNYVRALSNTGDIGIGDFLIIPAEIINESKSHREFYEGNSGPGFHLKNYVFRYCRSDYSKSFSMYLFAYDMFKQKNFDQAIHYMYMAEKYGLGHDWFICGIEFMCRNKEFYNTYIKELGSWFINTRLYDTGTISKFLEFFEKH